MGARRPEGLYTAPYESGEPDARAAPGPCQGTYTHSLSFSLSLSLSLTHTHTHTHSLTHTLTHKHTRTHTHAAWCESGEPKG